MRGDSACCQITLTTCFLFAIGQLVHRLVSRVIDSEASCLKSLVGLGATRAAHLICCLLRDSDLFDNTVAAPAKITKPFKLF